MNSFKVSVAVMFWGYSAFSNCYICVSFVYDIEVCTHRFIFRPFVAPQRAGDKKGEDEEGRLGGHAGRLICAHGFHLVAVLFKDYRKVS